MKETANASAYGAVADVLIAFARTTGAARKIVVKKSCASGEIAKSFS